MRVLETRVFRGPNPYGYRPVVRLTLDLQELEEYPSDRLPGFSDRLMQLQATTVASDVAVLIAPQLWEEGVDFRVVDAEGNYMSREATLSFLKTKFSRKNRS